MMQYCDSLYVTLHLYISCRQEYLRWQYLRLTQVTRLRIKSWNLYIRHMHVGWAIHAGFCVTTVYYTCSWGSEWQFYVTSVIHTQGSPTDSLMSRLCTAHASGIKNSQWGLCANSELYITTHRFMSQLCTIHTRRITITDSCHNCALYTHVGSQSQIHVTIVHYTRI